MSTQTDGEQKILELEDVHTYYGSIQARRPAWPDGRLKRPVDTLGVTR